MKFSEFLKKPWAVTQKTEVVYLEDNGKIVSVASCAKPEYAHLIKCAPMLLESAKASRDLFKVVIEILKISNPNEEMKMKRCLSILDQIIVEAEK